DGDAGAMEAADRLRRVLAPPFEIAGLHLTADASVGVTIYPGNASDADGLLQHADVAMYVAKSTHTGVALYSPADDHHSTDHLQLLTELRGALETDQLVLHYQPKLHLETGAVRGVEALVRWQHPQQKLLPPMMFVPAAERTNLIDRLTD